MGRRAFAIYLICAVLVVVGAAFVPSCTQPAEEEEEEGLPTFVAHFMTPEGEPYPFDVVISDGTWRKEFKNVTLIETEVPLEATYTFVYEEIGVGKSIRRHDFHFSPGETRILEFYTLPVMELRTRPYMSYQEVGADAALTWDWDPMTDTLSFAIDIEPGKWAMCGVAFDDLRASPHYALKATGSPWTGCCKCRNPYSGADVHWQRCFPLMMPEADEWVFSSISPDLGTVRVGYPLWNDSIITYPPDTKLYRISGDSISGVPYDAEYVDPQYAVPEGNYILRIRDAPEGWLSLGFPLRVEAGKREQLYNVYPPKIADLKPFTFSVAAEGPVAKSSYSSLTHDEEAHTLSVDVSTETDDDWWGCFVLPESATVTAVRSYAPGIQHDLVELYDYTINPVDGYNLITVRIPPEIDGLALQYTEAACVLDLVNNTLSPANNVVTPVGTLGEGKAAVKIDMGAGNSSVLEMKIEIVEPQGPWLLNIGNSPTNDGAGGDAGTFSNSDELDVTSDAANPNFRLQLYANDYFSTPGAVLADLVNLFPPTPALVPYILRIKIADQKMCALVENTGAERDVESQYIFRLGGSDTEAGLNDFIYYAAFNRVISGRPDRTGSGVKTVTFMWRNTWTGPDWAIP